MSDDMLERKGGVGRTSEHKADTPSAWTFSSVVSARKSGSLAGASATKAVTSGGRVVKGTTKSSSLSLNGHASGGHTGIGQSRSRWS